MSLITGHARFDGCLVRLDVPLEAVVSVLPPPLRLTHQERCHPCLLLFGGQNAATFSFLGFPFPVTTAYGELMVAVPNVHRSDASGSHLFVAGMVCDHWWMKLTGNLYYGFQKRQADITWDGRRFRVADGDSWDFDARITRRDESAGRELLSWIQASARMPVLGRLDDGRLVLSRFVWELDGLVEGIQVTVALGSRFRELPLGRSIEWQLAACRVHEMGWQIEWPPRVLRVQ